MKLRVEVALIHRVGIITRTPARHSHTSTISPQGVHESILLSVEDSDVDFWLIQMALEETKVAIQVYRVDDGEQAVHLLQRSGQFEAAPRPHLVLLDMNLPRRNGFEVLKFMKSQELIRDIPVVIFTSSSNLGEKQKALALGADQFVTKASTLDQLISDLKTVSSIHLQKSQSSRA